MRAEPIAGSIAISRVHWQKSGAPKRKRNWVADVAPDAPIEGAEFAALMARFEPFEPRPRVAVAVSGGADSMALTLLTERWARARGGVLTALTVDHRLRRDSAGE